MQDILFYIFAALTILPAVALVFSRKSVNSAMLMILSFIGTAALFALLQAYLLAVLQVVVYVGAVIVLFLFIAMLVGAGSPKLAKRDFRNMALASGVFVLLSLFGIAAIAKTGVGTDALPVSPASSAANFGLILFTKYQLAFEITGFLLLAAMVGVIFISKRPDSGDTTTEAE
jgi:NADH-quinone oxidoreductase subunit J